MDPIACRKERFASIRKSLILNPSIISATTRIEGKIEGKRRRASMQISNNETLINRSFEEISSEEGESSSLFHEKYSFGPKAGEGAHGLVNKCFDKKTGEVFAVKTIKLEQEQVMFLKQNFMDVKSLNHPHIITYRSLFFQLKHSRCYLLMDYLPFPDLTELAIADEEELKLITYQLLQTLAYVHQRKICHRDIKPENILYDRQKKAIKLIDFGISKSVEERGRKREMLTLTGTPYYRAPEMFSGGGYDERVDLWALGVTIFKLMTGYTPFEAEYHSDTISNIIKGDVVFPIQLKFQCSKGPKSLCRRLMKTLKERLTTEEALRDIWFMELRPKDELMQSLTFVKSSTSFDPKLSMRLPLSSEKVVQSSKAMACFHLFRSITEQMEIFGMGDDSF